jgi:putative endonuclease
MKDWYVYIILTKKNRFYTGISTDPERRFVEHLTDRKLGAKFFRSDEPLFFVYIEKVKSYSLALKKEIAIKRLKKGEKEKLANNHLRDFDQSLEFLRSNY